VISSVGSTVQSRGVEHEHVGVRPRFEIALARPESKALGRVLADETNECGGPERVVDERDDQLDPRGPGGQGEDLGPMLALRRPADMVRGDEIQSLDGETRRPQGRVDLGFATVRHER
jgi:hypothetical protein